MMIPATFVLFIFIGNSFAYNNDEILRLMRDPGQSSLNLTFRSLDHADSLKITGFWNETRNTTLLFKPISLGGDGATLVANNLRNSQITLLGLANNRIGIRGARALARVLNETRIKYLNISINEIGDEGVSAIAGVLKDTRITAIDVGFNEIGVEGARAMAKGLIGTRIDALWMGISKMGDEGVEAIADVLNDTVITHLDLWNDQIGDRGIRAIAQVLNDTGITVLELRSNKISRQSAELLISVLEGTEVETLRLWGISDTFHEDLNAKILELCSRNKLRMERLYQQFGDFVKIVNGSLEFDVEYVYTNKSEYVEFTRIVGNKKRVYSQRFISEGRTNYTRGQVEDFIYNIESRLDKCLRKLELPVLEQFKKFLVVNNRSLEFVVDYAYENESDYKKFAQIVGNNKTVYTREFNATDKSCDKYGENLVQDFVDDIQGRLEDCFRKAENIYREFESLVVYGKNGSLEFSTNKTNPREYLEFTFLISTHKQSYTNYLTSKRMGESWRHQVKDFVENINQHLIVYFTKIYRDDC